MKFSFASAEDKEQIKEILTTSDLHHQDIRPYHLQDFLTIKDGTALVGVVGLERKDNFGLLRSLAVAESYRRQGLATQLVGNMEEYARQQQVNTLYLLTLTAEGFFARLGYQRTNRKSAPLALQETTEFKALCPATAVCMKKHL